MKYFFLLLGLISAFCTLSAQPKPYSFRLDGEVVTIGDSKYEFINKIGRADGEIVREVELVSLDSPISAERRYVTVEQWFYNFGSRRKTMVFTFEDNRLVAIHEGEYGFDSSDPRHCAVVTPRIKIGDLMPAVLMKCGRPEYTETTYSERMERLNRRQGRRIFIRKETWIYNYGPSHPISVLEFENGKLIGFEKGERGY